MTTIKAHFDGKVLVPHQPVDLPVNEELDIQIERAARLVALTPTDLKSLFDEMDRDAVFVDHPIDYSRESIYGGTLDDPR